MLSLLVLSSVESASRFCKMMVLGEVWEAVLIWNRTGLPASQAEAQNHLIVSTCLLVLRLIGLVCMLVCMCAVFKWCLWCQEMLPGGFSKENQFFLILLASPKHIHSKPPDILNIMHMFIELQL